MSRSPPSSRKLLVADEPIEAMDPPSRTEIEDEQVAFQSNCCSLLSKYFFLYSSWIELGHAPSWNRSRSIRRFADNEIREEDFDLQLWKHRAFSIRIVALRLTLVMLEGYLFGSSVSWILSRESFSGELRSFGIGLVLGLWYIVWHWNRWPGSRYREFI